LFNPGANAFTPPPTRRSAATVATSIFILPVKDTPTNAFPLENATGNGSTTSAQVKGREERPWTTSGIGGTDHVVLAYAWVVNNDLCYESNTKLTQLYVSLVGQPLLYIRKRFTRNNFIMHLLVSIDVPKHIGNV
jgi:hypothetical protein